jgi:hypothetical protein
MIRTLLYSIKELTILPDTYNEINYKLNLNFESTTKSDNISKQLYSNKINDEIKNQIKSNETIVKINDYNMDENIKPNISNINQILENCYEALLNIGKNIQIFEKIKINHKTKNNIILLVNTIYTTIKELLLVLFENYFIFNYKNDFIKNDILIHYIKSTNKTMEKIFLIFENSILNLDFLKNIFDVKIKDLKDNFFDKFIKNFNFRGKNNQLLNFDSTLNNNFIQKN